MNIDNIYTMNNIYTINNNQIKFKNPSYILLVVSKYGIDKLFERLNEESNFDFYSINQNFVEYLIENGADINYNNGNSITPLFVACHYNNKDILQSLIKYNVDINIMTNTGTTAMDIVYANNNLDIANLLVDNGFDLYKDIDNEGSVFWKYMDLLLNTE